MHYHFKGKEYPTIKAMALSVNPIINASPDEMIERFSVNNVLQLEKRTIKENMNDKAL